MFERCQSVLTSVSLRRRGTLEHLAMFEQCQGVFRERRNHAKRHFPRWERGQDQ